MARLIKNYNNNKSCVKVGDSYTSCFPCLKGTKQCDKCSPQIFNFSINNICSHLNNYKSCGIFISNNIPNISSLLYADDVASPADAVIQLQRQINSVENFCHISGMKINSQKTQIVIFRNGGPVRKTEKWKLDDNVMYIPSFT